ncbi:hypothetical protein DFJ63DRAFT_337177 [Scheffersomyces coipomensis]|uniref:uncharacterized protein n=1 Tax=Scheffersomyces coipomensis TaxID=1788519 RepID=UPI00315D9B5A
MRVGTIITAVLSSLVMVRGDESNDSFQSIQLYVKSLSDNHIEQIGSIEFNQDRKKGQFISQSDKDIILSKDVDYCFGTKDLLNHDCFGYVVGNEDSLTSKNFHIFINAELNIDYISVNHEISDKTDVIVHNVIKSPVPNLNAEATKHQPKGNQNAGPKTEKVIQTKKVTFIDEDGNEVEREVEEEVEVEVDERSFIQKNWMYIVPTLLLFLVMSGDEKKE